MLTHGEAIEDGVKIIPAVIVEPDHDIPRTQAIVEELPNPDGPITPVLHAPSHPVHHDLESSVSKKPRSFLRLDPTGAQGWIGDEL